MKKIISASRRTDIPRFHYEWLQTVLRSGKAEIINPRFREKTYTVDLRPEAVHSLVLWSKDFTNVLRNPGQLADYNLYFQYTINDYPKALEANVPEYRSSIRTLEGLLTSHTPIQFNIRFDPVVFLRSGQPENPDPQDARLRSFRRLCQDLRLLGMADCRITTSAVAMYPHVKKRMLSAGIDFISYNDRQQLDFFRRMVDIAQHYGFQLFACASPLLEAVAGMNKGACIDGSLLEHIFGGKVSRARDQAQRKACGCYKSSDIGDYQKKCFFHCIYCYNQYT